MKKAELSLYRNLLGDIKSRVRQAQHRAALSANAEMIRLYWDIGRLIAARQEAEGWGSGVIPRLAADLKNELPEQKGFSARNIGRMIAFYREYSILPQAAAKVVPQLVALLPSRKPAKNELNPILPQAAAKLNPHDSETIEIVQQPAAQLALPSQVVFGLPWFHHVILIEKLKDLPTRYWYAQQALEQGWTRDTLTVQIKNRAHERQGTAITNFATTVPEAHAARPPLTVIHNDSTFAA